MTKTMKTGANNKNVIEVIKSDVVRLIKKGRMLLDGKMRTVVYLECEVDQTPVDQSFHYIHLLDTSGSMEYDLDTLKDSVIESIKGMDKGDKLTILEFNSPQNARFIVKGVEVNSETIPSITRNIKQLVARGGTCFSAPLLLAYEYISANLVKEHCSACIFTDGRIYAPWSDVEERAKTYEYVDLLSDLVTSINTLGYTNSYNDTFLKTIASKTRLGKYTHINDVSDYKAIFENDFKNLKQSVSKPMHIETQGMIMYQNEYKSVLNDNKLDLTHLNNNGNTIVCILDEGVDTIQINGETIEVDTIAEHMNDTEVTRFSYAVAKELAYNGKEQQSKEILNTLGEVQLAKQLDTTDRKVKQDIYDTLTTKSNQVTPTTDNLSDLTVLSVLEAIKEHKGYLDSQTFASYNKATPNAEEKKDLFVFKDTQPNLFNFKINSDGTNVNLPYVYTGEVTIDPEKANAAGLTQLLRGNTVRSRLNRSYSIIRNGEINIPVLVTHIPKTLYRKFMDQDMHDNYDFVEKIESSDIAGYKKVTLNLGNLPVLSTKVAAVDTIYNDYLQLCDLKCKEKVVKYYINQLQGDCTGFFGELDIEQLKVLSEHGLNNKFEYVGFGESKSRAKTKGVEFKVKGLSTIPKVADVIAHAKKSNYYVDHMEEYIAHLNEYAGLNPMEQIDVYQSELEDMTKQINDLTHVINQAKLAMYVNNSISTDFDGNFGKLSIIVNKETA